MEERYRREKKEKATNNVIGKQTSNTAVGSTAGDARTGRLPREEAPQSSRALRRLAGGRPRLMLALVLALSVNWRQGGSRGMVLGFDDDI